MFPISKICFKFLEAILAPEVASALQGGSQNLTKDFNLHKLYGVVQSEIDAVVWIHFRSKCYTPRIVFRGTASKYKCATSGNSAVFVRSRIMSWPDLAERLTTVHFDWPI